MKDFINKAEVQELWTVNGKKPSITTLWTYQKRGIIPTPVKHCQINLYPKEEVIRLRDEYFKQKRSK